MNLDDVVAPPAPPEVAVLDSDGVIVAVDDSWNRFARDNGAPPGWTGLGSSYLAVCEDAGDVTSLAVARAIRAAVRGELAGWAAIEVPCHSPTEHRWFDVVVSPRIDATGAPVGAVVSIVRVGDRESLPGDGVQPGSSGPESLVLDGYPDGLLAVDDEGRVVAANDALCTLFGRSRSDIVGHPVERLVPPGSRAMHRRMRAGFAHSPRRRTMGQPAQVLTGLRGDDDTVPVRVTLSAGELGGRRVILAAVRDASPIAAAESRARLIADLLDATADAIAVHRADDLSPVWVNRALADLCGCTREELVDDPQLAHEMLDLDALAAAARPLLEGRSDVVATRGLLPRRGGDAVPVAVRVGYRQRSPGEGYLVVVRHDLREAELAQAERERLARLEERARIARDLHDSVIQTLYATGMRMSAALEAVVVPAAQQQIVEATRAMDAAIDQLRATIARLADAGRRVPVRELLEAIVTLRVPMLRRHPDVTITGDPDVLPADVVDELLHVVTEAVSNVARHAEAAHTQVDLDVAADGSWQVRIRDDGRGFDPSATPRGHGLQNMATRAALLSAELTIRSAPGKGTEVVVRSGSPLRSPVPD